MQLEGESASGQICLLEFVREGNSGRALLDVVLLGLEDEHIRRVEHAEDEIERSGGDGLLGGERNVEVEFRADGHCLSDGNLVSGNLGRGLNVHGVTQVEGLGGREADALSASQGDLDQNLHAELAQLSFGLVHLLGDESLMFIGEQELEGLVCRTLVRDGHLNVRSGVWASIPCDHGDGGLHCDSRNDVLASVERLSSGRF